MHEGLKALLSLAPSAPHWAIDWAEAERSACAPWFARMKEVPQEKKWHGEGDVWTHTKLVCQALAQMEEYRALERGTQETVFLAVLLHDVGKIVTTRTEDGEIRAPKHGEIGSRMVRTMLWTEMGLCGSAEAQQLRETVCRLIRWHMAPLHMLEGDGERRLRRIAAESELLGGFSIRLLCLLAEADNRGRICDDLAEQLDKIELCRELAREHGCMDGPSAFACGHTQRAYFDGRNVLPDQPLYDDTWGEVILLCALPGTGKDTWIAANCPQLPMVSLDDMRDEMGVLPTDNQGAVAQACKESARRRLRAKEPFVFNATNLTPLTREPLVRLFEQYGARVRIVYLETEWQEEMRRNAARRKAVPEGVIHAMLEKLAVPERAEARTVEWICV